MTDGPVYGLTISGYPAPEKTGFWVGESTSRGRVHIEQCSMCPEPGNEARTGLHIRNLHIRKLCRTRTTILVTNPGDQARRIRSTVGGALNRVLRLNQRFVCQVCQKRASNLNDRIADWGYYPRCTYVHREEKVRCELTPGHRTRHFSNTATTNNVGIYFTDEEGKK